MKVKKMKKSRVSKAKIADFLKDVQEVCKKHDMYFGGCGCCGSPFVTGRGSFLPVIENVDIGDVEIDFVRKNKKYVFDGKAVKNKKDD